MTQAGVKYAQEVYAACATVGFEDEKVRRLKLMLDQGTRKNADLNEAAIVALAQDVQLRCMQWAQRKDNPVGPLSQP